MLKRTTEGGETVSQECNFRYVSIQDSESNGQPSEEQDPPMLPPELNHNRSRASVRQEDVLPTDGFVDMNKDAYSWSQAFPSLFAPRYDKDDGKWHIYHDLTGWEGIREASKPNFG